MLDCVPTENSVIRAWYNFQEDGDVKVVMSTHVDGMRGATKPENDHTVQDLLDRLFLKTMQFILLFWIGNYTK